MTDLAGIIDRIQDTVFLQRVVEVVFPMNNFLSTYFFSDVNYHNTSAVILDKERKSRQIAKHSSPFGEGHIVQRKKFTTKAYTTPYVKEVTVMDTKNLTQRSFGQNPFTPARSPMQKAMEQLGKDTAMLKDRLYRLIEKQCADVMLTGKYEITDENGQNFEIDLEQPNDNKWSIAGGQIANAWNLATADILGDIEKALLQSQRNTAQVPKDVVMGFNVYSAFRQNDDIRDLLDNRKIESGELKLNLLPEGLRFIGTIGAVDYWVYVEFYEEEDGTLTHVMNPDRVIISSRSLSAGIEYGPIYDLDYGQFEADLFLKSFKKDNPSALILILQSSPLPIHNQMEGVITINPFS